MSYYYKIFHVFCQYGYFFSVFKHFTFLNKIISIGHLKYSELTFFDQNFGL